MKKYSQTLTNNMNRDQTIPNLPHYEIKIEGRVDEQWQIWFYDMDISPTDEDNTMLCGPLTDQAALHGVLKKINNLGLTLISVNPKLPSE